MMSLFPPSLRRVLAASGEINPLWIAALGAVALALLASHAVQQDIRTAERLQDRLTGSALVDALKAYAEATPAGQAARPPGVEALGDDARDGAHRDWLDSASAEALRDASRWELLRDPQGGLRGARLHSAPAGPAWLPAWLGGEPAGADTHADVYLAEVAETAAPAPTPLSTVAVLPQPVMPDTPLPQPAPAQAATGPARRVAAPEARPVLRLSSGEAEPLVLAPRRAPPPPPPAGSLERAQTTAIHAQARADALAKAAARVQAAAAIPAEPVAVPFPAPATQAPAATPVVQESCNALGNDSGRCDAFEDTDSQLYQRCYQSLAARLDACQSGQPPPPLVTQ